MGVMADQLGAQDAREARTVSQEQQAALLDLAHDAILVRDLEKSAIQYWNRGAEELYGWTSDEAIGQVSHALLQTEFPEPLEGIEVSVIETGEWQGELIQKTRDGRRVVVASRWALQRTDGRPSAFLEINRDVTARKKAEEQVNGLLDEREHRLRDLAKAHAQAQRHNRELLAVNAAMRSITEDLDLARVLQRIVDEARDLVGSRYAALGVADDQGRILQFITSGIEPEERAAIGPLPQGHGLLGVLIREGQPLRVPVIADHPDSHGFPPNHPPMTSLLGVPILFRGKALGDLYLTDKIGSAEFSQEDEDLLSLLAQHAALAIQNARLYEQSRSARDQLRQWNRSLEATVAERTREIERISRDTTARVLGAQEEERKRIARELHDETAQSLTRLLIDLEMLREHVELAAGPLTIGLDRFEQVLRRTLEEVRGLSHDLRPAILDDFGLVPAIEAYAEEWTQTFGVPVTVDLGEDVAERLSPEAEVVVFRIVQEALMNAGKYARASAVHVALTRTGDGMTLVVEDNGGGFSPEDVGDPTRRGGLGLHGMRERAALLGGTLTIEAAPGGGTRIVLTVQGSYQPAT